MVWAHASRLHNLFAVSQIASIGLVEWLEKARPRISAEFLGRELASWNDVLHPRRQNRANFLVHAVASIISGHDPQMIEHLGVRDLLLATGFTGDNENRSPQLSLLHDSTLASNALDSFLGGDPSAILTLYIGNEFSTMLASSSLKSMVKEAIQNLKSDPLRQSEWGKIAAIVGDLPMYGDLGVEFRELMEQIDLRSLDVADPLAARLALRVAVDQVVHLGDEPIRSRYQDGLLEIARSQAS